MAARKPATAAGRARRDFPKPHLPDTQRCSVRSRHDGWSAPHGTFPTAHRKHHPASLSATVRRGGPESSPAALQTLPRRGGGNHRAPGERGQANLTEALTPSQWSGWPSSHQPPLAGPQGVTVAGASRAGARAGGSPALGHRPLLITLLPRTLPGSARRCRDVAIPRAAMIAACGLPRLPARPRPITHRQVHGRPTPLRVLNIWTCLAGGSTIRQVVR